MKVITFYSYKGGVGRSTSLCNIAYALDEMGKSVFLIDFDIESSGLNAILKRDSSPSNGKIFQNILCAESPDLIEEIISNSVIMAPKSKIRFIPAGIEYDATRRVNDLMGTDRNKVFTNVEKFLEIVEKKYNPDFLFFDSRAGISNMAEPAFTYSDSIVIVFRMGIQQLIGIEGLSRWLINYFIQIGQYDVNLYLLASNIHPEASSLEEINGFIDEIIDSRNEEIQEIKSKEEIFPIIKYGVIWQNDILNKHGSMVLFNVKMKEQYSDILENYRTLARKLVENKANE